LGSRHLCAVAGLDQIGQGQQQQIVDVDGSNGEILEHIQPVRSVVLQTVVSQEGFTRRSSLLAGSSPPLDLASLT